MRIGPRDLLIAIVAGGLQFGIGRHLSTICAHAGCVGGVTGHDRLTSLDAVLFGLAAAGLLFRRRRPRVVLGAVAVLATVAAALGAVSIAMLPVLAVAFVTVVLRGDRTATWTAIAWALIVWLPLSIGVSHIAAPAAWLIVIGFASEVIRTRRGRIVAQRRSREEASLRRVEEERLRIARELHDVVAHNISLINIQSGVALHLLDERPEQARTALSIINDASGEALRELRAVLGALRRVDEQAPRRPAPGLERLDELIAGAVAGGIEVRRETEGRPRPLPAPVDLAAYRIVQESLTNVARHGGGRAVVTLDYASAALAIEVQDDGSGTREAGDEDPGSGNGLLGMRERAAALGGELDAGPRPDASGFRVRARLPYGERP